MVGLRGRVYLAVAFVSNAFGLGPNQPQSPNARVNTSTPQAMSANCPFAKPSKINSVAWPATARSRGVVQEILKGSLLLSDRCKTNSIGKFAGGNVRQALELRSDRALYRDTIRSLIFA